MQKKNKRIELLAPAGNFEKLTIAVKYGADAVYLAGKEFSLRNFSGNFSLEELKKAVEYAHERDVKVYVAVNIYSRNNDLPQLEDYLKYLAEISPDALIVSDPAIIVKAREIAPDIELHLSTQANTTNAEAVKFWAGQGIERVNLARELSIGEVYEIAQNSKVETEVFIHGAMCISYSGRCLLSNYMTLRGGNSGTCTQPCRFSYEVVEAKRPGEYWPVMEDKHGTHIFNSRDLCMIEHIPELMESGVSSLKIEGRMKGVNYLASAVRIYRQAIDSYLDNPHEYVVKPQWLEELATVHHRDYCTGFYFGDPRVTSMNYKNYIPATVRTFVANVLEGTHDGKTLVLVRNRLEKGEELLVIGPKGDARKDRIIDIIDEEGTSLDFVNPNYKVELVLSGTCCQMDLIQRKEMPGNEKHRML